MIINSNKIPTIASMLISSKIVCKFGLDNRNKSEARGIASYVSPLSVSQKLSTRYEQRYKQNVQRHGGHVSAHYPYVLSK